MMLPQIHCNQTAYLVHQYEFTQFVTEVNNLFFAQMGKPPIIVPLLAIPEISAAPNPWKRTRLQKSASLILPLAPPNIATEAEDACWSKLYWLQ
jgi:hypothetical protein